MYGTCIFGRRRLYDYTHNIWPSILKNCWVEVVYIAIAIVNSFWKARSTLVVRQYFSKSSRWNLRYPRIGLYTSENANKWKWWITARTYLKKLTRGTIQKLCERENSMSPGISVIVSPSTRETKMGTRERWIFNVNLGHCVSGFKNQAENAKKQQSWISHRSRLWIQATSSISVPSWGFI